MSNSSEIPQIDPGLRARAARDFALYGAARLGLFLVLTVVIQGLALLVAFPLSMFVFKKLRVRVTQEMAAWDAQRKAHKAWVKKELSER